MEVIGLTRALSWPARRVELWWIFGRSPGTYGVWLKEAKQADREKCTVTISRKRGDLLVVDMDMTEEKRGAAHGLVEMNRRTLEGQGSYRHLIDGAEPMFGTWHLKVWNRDTIDATTRYSRAGHPEQVIGYTWRRIDENGELSAEGEDSSSWDSECHVVCVWFVVSSRIASWTGSGRVAMVAAVETLTPHATPPRVRTGRVAMASAVDTPTVDGVALETQ